MKILLLPGASGSNKQWVDTWSQALSGHGHEVKPFYYDHWGKEQMFSLEHETEKFSRFDMSWRKDIVVIAKSIGSVLCLFATRKGIISPAVSIFMGFPSRLNGSKDATINMDIKKWLDSYSVPATIFQNEHDPVTSYEEVRDFVKNNSQITAISVPGNTHKYTTDMYLPKIESILSTS